MPKDPTFFAPHTDISLKSLQDYLSQFQSAQKILKSIFNIEIAIDYTINNYINEKGIDQTLLSKTAIELLAPLDDALIKQRIPTSFTPTAIPARSLLAPKVKIYVGLLWDVLNNKLAEKLYSTAESEKVTEKEHAFEALHYALALRLSDADAISLFLHDIARTIFEDTNEGHKHHGEQGYLILRPLGEQVATFSRYHTAAKKLLFLFCNNYKSLMSPTSQKSLELQEEEINQALTKLHTENLEELAFNTYNIMTKRAIDDLSKIELELLQKKYKTRPDILSEPSFTAWITRQIDNDVQIQLAAGKANNISDAEVFIEFTKKIDAGCALLIKAQRHTNNPVFYQDNYATLKLIEVEECEIPAQRLGYR